MFRASYYEKTIEDVEVDNSMTIIMAQLVEWGKKASSEKQKKHVDILQKAMLKLFSFNVTTKSKLSRALVEMLEERKRNSELTLLAHELKSENKILKSQIEYFESNEKQLNERIADLTKFDPK